jgi:murein L,D-transpeptidase YafK
VTRARQSAGFGLFVLLVAALATAVWFLAPLVSSDPEQRAIDQQRAVNLARATANLPLPGTPDLGDLTGRLQAAGVALGAPVLIRIFKREFELEVWMWRDGRYARFAAYPICRWSGRLGPKSATGDKQAPEGFYSVAANQMNPHSRWHRSFDLGFPNTFDAAHGRTGSALMVHGGCSSVGCYAMTNAVMDEIWRLTTAAQTTGKQRRFQVQVYPFRMDSDALMAREAHPQIAFWRQLKVGHDLFEQTGRPPVVRVCQRAYRFTPGSGFEASAAPCDTSAPIPVHRAKKPL